MPPKLLTLAEMRADVKERARAEGSQVAFAERRGISVNFLRNILSRSYRDKRYGVVLSDATAEALGYRRHVLYEPIDQ